MRRRILILTYTHFQLITAIQLKLTELKSDDVDVIVTDQSKGSREAALRLRNMQIFQSVFFVHDSDGLEEFSQFDKYRRYLSAWINPEKRLKGYVELSGTYDMFFFHNASLLTHLICHCLGKKTACFRFDEGYSTYTKPLLNKKWLHRWMIRCAFGNIRHRLQGVYLFHPELFRQKVNCPLFPIKPIGSGHTELKQILNEVFNYVPDSQLQDADYIFLEESIRLHRPMMDDVDLVCQVADLVGIERVVVKQHPRSRDNPFQERGIATVQSKGIPWEVILMNEDFSHKTILSVMSGTALAPALYRYPPIKTYLLFRCVPTHLPELNRRYMEFIRELSPMGWLTIPESLKDFLQQLIAQESIKRKKGNEE